MVMMLATVMVVRMMLVRMFWAGTSTVPEEETGGRQLEARRNLSGHRETDPDENHELSCG